MGMAQRQQQEAEVASALALCCQFTVHRDTLHRVEVFNFKYLGRMMAQDNNNIQAMQHQLHKAQGTWARVGQILRRENVAPQVAAKFYKAVIQAVLLYGSKTWNLTKAVLARLEGFHVRAAYHMAQVYRPKRMARNRWVYLKMSDVLEDCSMEAIQHYIEMHWSTIVIYIYKSPHP
jgi:hypothetical protein